MEEWKDIPGFEGRYQVSNEGRVKSVDHYGVGGTHIILYKGKILTPVIGTDKYYHVFLSYGKGKKKACLIHRLVAEVFIPNHEGKREVNHKDENKLNNHVSNLEWVTSKENANYGTRNRRSVEKRIENGYILPVLMLDSENKIINEFESAAEAARYVNGANGNIHISCRNNGRKAYGYKWQYKSNFQS